MFGKKHQKRTSLLPQILCGLTLCFTIFVFAPIDMYALNSSNFWFTVKDFVPIFLMLFVAAFVILQVLFLGLRLLPRALYLLFLATLGGVMVATYVQGNYLCMTNEVLGGGALPWNDMLQSAGLNMLIWAAILFVFIGVMLVKPRFFTKMLSAVSALILVMEGAALAVTLVNYVQVDTSSNYVYYSNKDQYTYSQEGDVIIYMVDTLDTRLFDRVLEENPEYLKEFDGFTYYRNASSCYRKTDPSFVSILTGYLCRNENPFFTDVTKAFEESSFLPTLKQNGFDVNIYGGPSGLFNQETMKQVDNLLIKQPYIASWQGFAKTMLQMVAYRYAPNVLQPFVFGEYTDEFEQYKEVPDGLPASTYANDSRYRSSFREQGITIDNERRFFKFYAMQGSHTPYNMDRNGETVEAGSVDIYEKTLGSFSILDEMLAGLKESGVYDNATIIVLADHGDGWICNPTLLVKYPQSDNEGIIKSEAPVELLDVRATVLYGAGLQYETFGTPVHMWEGVTDRQRIFYAYDWVKPEGFDFYLSKLTEYAVPADATNLEEYVSTGNYYSK